ncbi:MAG: glycosyltransferase family 2 protein [Planctomycetota bacterium]
MKITAVCVTYKRPYSLARLIGCFEAQDYPDRELVILDDAGQYDDQEGPGWRLRSMPQRYATLGAKRNAALAMTHGDAVAVWDDDDCYLPWALSACAAALERAPWCRPGLILIANADRTLTRHQTWTGSPRRKLFHAAWAFRRELLTGYPNVNSGEDQRLMSSLLLAKTPEADPIELGHRPYCVVSWAREPAGECPKLSWMEDGWKHNQGLPAPKWVGHILPTLPAHFDYRNPEFREEIKPRPF